MHAGIGHRGVCYNRSHRRRTRTARGTKITGRLRLITKIVDTILDQGREIDRERRIGAATFGTAGRTFSWEPRGRPVVDDVQH